MRTSTAWYWRLSRLRPLARRAMAHQLPIAGGAASFLRIYVIRLSRHDSIGIGVSRNWRKRHAGRAMRPLRAPERTDITALI